MASLRWGILGPGRIAHKFAKSLPFSGGLVQAVASTNYQRASDFSSEYSIPFVFDCYETLLRSGEVDVVYIATTNQLHFENAALALGLGVPVLCEKPLTLSALQTQELIALSAQHQTFLMEGMWTVFLPHVQKAWQWIHDGRIGEVVHVQADFGYKASFDPSNRLFNAALGGSVTRDVGVYPVSLFYKTLGTLEQIQSIGTQSVTGVDDHVLFQGKATSGATFQGMVSFRTQSLVEATILGTEGRIKLSSQWLRPTTALLETEGGHQLFAPEVPAFGFQYEAAEVERCLAAGFTESPVMSHADSLAVAQYIDQILDF